MKNFLVLVAFSLSFGCTGLLHTKCNMEYINSVGGISVGTPYLDEEDWFLPVNVDLSGLQFITCKPTQLNSAVICSKIKHEITDSLIFITVYKGLAGSKPVCDKIKLGQLTASVYKVYCRDESSDYCLGEIAISK